MSNIRFAPMPEISIILPTYNRAKYLSNCINSVIEQVVQDWELIVVDDGSADETFKIVNLFVDKFDKIRYFKHKNRKAGFSRNAGIQASFGQYITFIDSDDRYKPEHLQSRLDYMKQHPELDLIEGGFETNEDVWVADYYNLNKKINIYECVLGPTFFGKRHVFFELQGFKDMAYAEDTDLWLRAEEKFNTRKLTEPKTYFYTRAEDSTSRNF